MTDAKTSVSEDREARAEQKQDKSLSPPVASTQLTPHLEEPPSQNHATRNELITRARAFLSSLQVQHQDTESKRAFLREKGLTEADIDDLLRSLPPQMPSIPPRTYPLPPPSSLPVLLLGLARLFSWIVGGSAVLLFIYHRLLLPRIVQTSSAQHSLRSHHLSLLRQLITSLASLKESQAEEFSVLPRPDPWKEPKSLLQCRSVKDVLNILSEQDSDYSQIHPVTLLRCGIQDFSQGKEGRSAMPTTPELFGYLEEQIPWLMTEDGGQFEEKLWDTLTAAPIFKQSPPSSSPVHDSEDVGGIGCWQCAPTAPPAEPPLLKSMAALRSSLPKDTGDRKSPFQYTFQSLSDFTGYISAQVYLPYRPVGFPNTTNTVEDEVRREIKALKGLVLNRRSFMTSTPRPLSGLGTGGRITP